MSNIMKKGLFPITILVRIALMIEIGQLHAKQANIRTSKILKLAFVNITIYFFT